MREYSHVPQELKLVELAYRDESVVLSVTDNANSLEVYMTKSQINDVARLIARRNTGEHVTMAHYIGVVNFNGDERDLHVIIDDVAHLMFINQIRNITSDITLSQSDQLLFLSHYIMLEDKNGNVE